MFMLLNYAKVISLPLASIRSSAKIGYADGLVINPNNLHVDAIWCSLSNGKRLLLSPMDIRGLSLRGVIINDHENLLEETDAIRLKPILQYKFNLVDKIAYLGKRKIGRVEDFAINIENLYIQKIYIKPNILNRFAAERMTFDRSSVEEVTNQKIIFKNHNTVKVMNLKENPVLPHINLSQPSVNASLTSENE